MDTQNKEIEKIRELAITKQLNFLIGSGVSTPAIPLMGTYSDFSMNEANKMLEQEVINVSEKLLSEYECSENGNYKKDISIVLSNYRSFIESIVEILNLSNSRQTPKNANIFTTNYDLFIEKATDEVLKNFRLIFNDGASGYFERYLDSSNFNRTVAYRGLNDNYINEIPSITLIKPHGSVNWEKKNDDIVIKNQISNSPVIVQPNGYESRSTFEDNHFHEMLRVFQLELDKKQSVLFVIGFSLQDKHISKMIKRSLQNPELIIYIFGYSDNDRNVLLSNLGVSDERANLKILTPYNFGESLSNFTISDLTNILKGFKEKDI